MDSVIDYLVNHGIVVSINPTSVITWSLLYFLYQIAKDLRETVDGLTIKVTTMSAELTVTNTRLRDLAARQKEMHDDNVVLWSGRTGLARKRAGEEEN